MEKNVLGLKHFTKVFSDVANFAIKTSGDFFYTPEEILEMARNFVENGISFESKILFDTEVWKEYENSLKGDIKCLA